MKSTENYWTIQGWGQVGRRAVEDLHWLKHNACIGKIPRQKSYWTTNRHLNNEGQECKTGFVSGRVIVGWERSMKRVQDGEYG
jgi:hypothetical protein